MPTTVNAAFDLFLAETVNLASDVTDRARGSRDWLITQLSGLREKDAALPLPFEQYTIAYGSFARRTKIRELDDVDLLWCMHAEGSVYQQEGSRVYIASPDQSRLARFRYEGGGLLNSRLVINQYVRSLAHVPQYSKAERGRNGEAAVLNLKSYSWSFDIVPGFFTLPERDGRTYYLIPDGAGHWKKTDPRLDRDRVTRLNTANNGNLLNVLRIMKFWNRRPTMPTMPSYMLENLILDHYEPRTDCARFVDLEVGPLLSYIRSAVFGPVWDPKGIQGDLNTLSYDERVKISNRAAKDLSKVYLARLAEMRGDQQSAIAHWSDVFGPAFPSYT